MEGDCVYYNKEVLGVILNCMSTDEHGKQNISYKSILSVWDTGEVAGRQRTVYLVY